MKKIVFISLTGLIISACSTLDISENVSLSLTPSTTKIILGEANEFSETVDFSWEVSNRSEVALNSPDYAISILSARPGSMEATVIHETEIEIAPQTSQKGSYTYFIDGISSEGEFEFQLVLYKQDGEYFEEISKISTPYTLNWEE